MLHFIQHSIIPHKKLLFSGLLFLIIGFVLWMPAIMIPYLRVASELNYLSAYSSALALYLPYVGTMMVTEWVARQYGARHVLALGLLIMISGTALLLIGLITRWHSLCLVGFFLLGTGLAGVQWVALAYLKAKEITLARLRKDKIPNIANKIGGIVGILGLGAFLMSNIDALNQSINQLSGISRAAELDALAQRAIVPFGLFLILLILLWSAAQYASWLPMPSTSGKLPETNKGEEKAAYYPKFWLGALALMCYAGVESIIVNSMVFHSVRSGFTLQEARFMGILPLLTMLLGYVGVNAYAPHWLGNKRVLWISSLAGLIISVAIILIKQQWALAALPLLGIVNCITWASLFTLSLAEFHGSKKTARLPLQACMAGAALLLIPYAMLADAYSLRYADGVLVAGYIVILTFALAILPRKSQFKTKEDSNKKEEAPSSEAAST